MADIIAGKYEVVRTLGAGTLGIVYECRHRELGGMTVALKVLYPEYSNKEEFLARLKEQIIHTSSVPHPNVVQIYEYLRHEDLVAYSMEYVDGGDLADYISPEEPLPVSDVIDIFARASAGLQALHELDIVHGNLKPENILLARDGEVKLTDYVGAIETSGPKLTEQGGVVGTIDYVSPEYLETSTIDARSDIYALGAIAYEMLVGRPPFEGTSAIETMTARLKTDPPLPDKARPDCPLPLQEVIMKCLARDPSARFQSAGELAEAMMLLSEQRQVH